MFRSCALVLIAILSSQVAQALPLPGLHKLRRPHRYSAALSFPNCTDFSGTWAGRCVNSDGSVDENQATVISQEDCRTYTEDGYDIEIGGSNRTGMTSFIEGDNLDAVYTPNWNSSHTMITAATSLSWAGEPFGPFSSVMKTSIAIEDGKLRIVSKTAGTVSTSTFPGLVDSDCTYQKQ